MTDQNQPIRTAPPEVCNLVNRFAEQRDVYKSGKYNETQLRRDFLDSLFKELGWDVDNRKNLSETNRDVINEISVEMEGHSKAADYAFKTNNKIFFFLEAKKPSVNIETNPAPAFQLRSYGWTAKLPFSVLSDFEQLAIYDCRIKPVYGDTPLIARHKLYTYTDYVDKWDEIYNLLSYDAVHAGSLDKLVETVKGKRGTADVDDDFLATMEHWREELARVISLRNLSLSQRQINTAVQLIIDRIIFLRICEDRGIEPEQGLRDATDGVDVYGDLMALFKKADKKYNSGLFHFDVEKGQSSHPDTLTPSLKIDDKVFKDILANLYLPKSPYAFKYFSADILGQVYERFLGKVITLSDGHRSKVIEKPEVRKAGGVYYTPTYIVEYIVKNTVGELLKDATPAHMLVEPIRVLDPACGSGSFLLGAYQYLLDWYLAWYSTNDPVKWSKGKNPPIFDNNGWQLTMEKKKEILTSHIFGVDIDAQAVEVTKLSLLLKVVENPGQLSLLGERILPDLGENIKCGNSLIGPDYYQNQQFTMFDSEEQNRVNAFDWETAFPNVFAKGGPAPERQRRGFDAVIGNPPYLGMENMESVHRDYYYGKYQNGKKRFRTAVQKANLYSIFWEKAISLSMRKGFIGFITPYSWLSNSSFIELRRIFLETTVLSTNLLPLGIFIDAGIKTCTTIVYNSPCTTDHKICVQDLREQKLIDIVNILGTENFCSKLKIERIYQTSDLIFNIDVDEFGNDFTRKILDNNVSLNTLCVANRGCDTANNEKFTGTDDIKKLNPKHLLEGKNFWRYGYKWNGLYLYYLPEKMKKENNKARPGEKERFEVEEKIIIYRFLNSNNSLVCAFDDEKNYCLGSSYVLLKLINTTENLKYILAILNSKLIAYLNSSLFNGVKVTLSELNRLPIRTINFSNPAEVKQHDRMVALVESMLALHKTSACPDTKSGAVGMLPDEKERLARQIQFTDKQIDQLVYQLYGLSEEEIQIVESTS